MNEDIYLKKVKVKMSLFTDDIIPYVENAKKLTNYKS